MMVGGDVQDISAGIVEDKMFELIMRNSWHISGGQGEAANSSNLRVMVTTTSGEQKVVEVKDDLGVRYKDQDRIIAMLKAQGCNDIAKISSSN